MLRAQTRGEQPGLATEAVVDHPFRGHGLVGYLVDASSVKSVPGEMIGCHLENVRPGPVQVPGRLPGRGAETVAPPSPGGGGGPVRNVPLAKRCVSARAFLICVLTGAGEG